MTKRLISVRLVAASALILLAVALTAGCGSSSGGNDSAKVWCVAPGEKVTPAFRREYPELYIAKAACDAIKQKG